MTDNKTGITIAEIKVAPEWIDFNGHMGDYTYHMCFSQSANAYMKAIGLDDQRRQQSQTTLYTLEISIRYHRECHLGEDLIICLWPFQVDRKKLNIYFQMLDQSGNLRAECQTRLLYVHQTKPKPVSAPFPADIAAKLNDDLSDLPAQMDQAWIRRF